MENYMSYQPKSMLNQDRINEIARSMSENGWVGAPMVVWCDVIVTGNHRYEAAKIAEIDVETITIEEIFEEAGVDFSEAHFEAGCPAGDEPIDWMGEYLSDDIINEYGIQW